MDDSAGWASEGERDQSAAPLPHPGGNWLSLSDELWLRIASHLDDVPDALALVSTCRRLRPLVSDGSLWRSLCIKRWNMPHPPFEPPALTDWRQLARYRSLLPANPRDVLGEALEASSTDYRSQSIYNTVVRTRDFFWSSEGSPDPGLRQSLSYRLSHPLCVVSSVGIAFHGRLPYVFCPLRVKCAVSGAGPSHTVEFAATTTDQLQRAVFYVPLVGNTVTFELCGAATAYVNQLFYHAVDFVEILGQPLSALEFSSPLLHASLVKRHEAFLADTRLLTDLGYVLGDDATATLNVPYWFHRRQAADEALRQLITARDGGEEEH